MKTMSRLYGVVLSFGLIGAAYAQSPPEAPPPPLPEALEQSLEQARDDLRAAARHYAEILEAQGLRPPRWNDDKETPPLPGTRRGFLGLRLGTSGDHEAGLPIVSVAEESGAAEAGLRVGDRLLSINGQALVPDAGVDRGLRKALRGLRAGETANVVYLRDGLERSATVKLGKAQEANRLDLRPLLREGGALLPMMNLAPMNAELAVYFGGQDRGVLVLSRRVVAGIELQGGDIIVAVNGEPVESPRDLARGLWREEGDPLKLDVIRGGVQIKLESAAPLERRSRPRT